MRNIIRASVLKIIYLLAEFTSYRGFIEGQTILICKLSGCTFCPVTPSRGDKCVETLGSKIQFSSVLETFPPFPPQTMILFLFLRLHRLQHLNNIELGAGGIR